MGERRVFYDHLFNCLVLAEESEERPQQTVFYGAGNKTELLDMNERRDSEDLDAHLPLSLAYLPLCQASLDGC